MDVTLLPTCGRCGGSFYPHPNPDRFDHLVCEDCFPYAIMRWNVLIDAFLDWRTETCLYVELPHVLSVEQRVRDELKEVSR